VKLLVSALEPSANLHLEPILEELKEYELLGIFDEKFATPLYSSSEFSVMGFFDVLPKIFKAKEAIKEMTFLAKDADTILLIDSPAFNLPLAKSIKKKYPNKKIIYYILPKIWAWKKRRLKDIEKYCNFLASIFPFEQKFYNRAIYVGNPLLDEISRLKNPNTTYNRVAFMPGSRKSEIKNLLPVFKKVASSIDKEKVLIVPKFFKGQDLDALYGDISEFKISYNMQNTLSQSDFAFICSGTATLEASIIGVPFVLAYKMRQIEYIIAKTFIKLPYAGLANLIMHFENKEPIHKEFLQNDLTVKNLLNEYKNFDIQKFSTSSKELKKILISGSSKNVVNLL
jgi:lipid-A-disaccharide synthase